MPRSADYLGLLAYMFVMYGGLPGSDSLWLDSSQPRTRHGQRRPKLKIVAANTVAKRRRKAAITATEVAA
jgi:hypothetical protein